MKAILFSLLIFAFAAFFRLFHLDLIEFKYDEAYTVFQMVQFYENPYLMQVGPPQSTGVYNFPLFNYMMIVLSLFSRSPVYLSFLIGLANSLSAVLFYLLFRKRFGDVPAFLSGLFLALAPWSIIFSRKIWIPDLIFPFALLAVYYLVKLVADKERKAVFPLAIFISLLIQMHASGVFFAAITAGLLLILKIKIDYKPAVKGLLTGFIPAIPYFFRQLVSTPFCVDCSAFFKYQETVRNFDPVNFLRPWDFYSGLSFPVSLGKSYPDFIQAFPVVGNINYLYFIGYPLLFIGMLFAFKSQKKYLFLLAYPLALPLLYFLTKTPAIMHYFVVLFPLMAVLLLVVLKSTLDYLKSGWYYGAMIIISSLLFVNLIFDYCFQQFVQNTKNIQGDYGPVYALTKKQMDEELDRYSLLPNYAELRSYAFMFAQSPYFHGQLGNYFLQKGQVPLAIGEYNQALLDNPQDLQSRADLVYVYTAAGNKDKALENLKVLSSYDAAAAARLKQLLKIE